MPIQFIPKPGAVLLCNFGPDPSIVPPQGFACGPVSVPPEMIKERPVVVIATPTGFGLSVVVPLSTKMPPKALPCHHCIPAGSYPFLDPNIDSWAKADLVQSVSFRRLDRLKVNGFRAMTLLRAPDLNAILACFKSLAGP